MGSWLGKQRVLYRKGTLSKERGRQLKCIGFKWALQPNNDAIWEEHFNELVAYKQVNGDYNATNKLSDGKFLGSWMCHQRGLYKKETLSKERITKLEGVGFKWTGIRETVISAGEWECTRKSARVKARTHVTM